MLTPEQLADLRAKAEAATPGPWVGGRHDMFSILDGYKSKYIYAGRDIVAVSPGWDKKGEAQVIADAVFIAAANPATVLQLLEMVERLEKERNWLANHAPEMNEYGDHRCPYRFMPQDKKCPMWTQGRGDSPEDDSYEAWKICVFGEYDFEGDTINCGTDYTKCWRYVASKAVEESI